MPSLYDIYTCFACDQLLVIILHCFNAFSLEVQESLVRAETIKKTEMSRDSDGSGEGTGRGKETDGGLFFMYIFCFFFKTWRGE